jgi:predicted secreted hydrolase
MTTNQSNAKQGSGLAQATAPQTVAATVQNNLNMINAAVNAIIDPITNQPVEIPDFETLYNAAGTLGTGTQSADYIAAISYLLGRASDFDCQAPPASYKPVFPYDHHLHTKMGMEWYYVCMHLNVTDPKGNKGRIGVLQLMNKQRTVGNTAQNAAGWSDENALLFSSLATATLSFGDTSSIVRRSNNAQWPAVGGSISYSQPTAGSPFLFQCGADSLSGSADVLPLQVTVNDGQNLSFSLRLNCQSSFTAPNAFFLQGIPSLEGGGTGITNVPTPGIYYSWPQLVVDVTGGNTITVENVTYTVDSGTAWIDHQLMMQSLQNAGGAASPVPFNDDPAPFSGWCWQFFNLAKGDAFTGASFVNWYLSANPSFVYGYYVKPDSATGKWLSYFLDAGSLQLNDFQSYPTPVCPVPMGDTINLPTSRNYNNVENSLLGNPLNGIATPWCDDGRFNSQSFTVISEAPADYKDTSGNYSDGVGFLETVGFEPKASVRARLLNFLTTGIQPCMLASDVKNEQLQ